MQNTEMQSINEQPWLQRSGENNAWYQRFSEYLVAGAGRSIRGVYNAEKGNEKSKAVPASWTEAAKRYEWQRRAEAYDAWRRAEVFQQGNAQDTERVKKLDVLIDKLYNAAIAELTSPQAMYPPSADKLTAQLMTAMDLMAKHTGGYAPSATVKVSKDGSIEVDGNEKTNVIFYMPEIAALPEPDIIEAGEGEGGNDV